ncbi:hypothetical protein SAMN05660742_10166 [Propionispira arboris]|uniref:Uncharacterized protein n=2 Tax=Propionispira TaxID=84034 RepID=A0A1H6TH92_9FIRM|nr:hypothetical protein SAMN05660742_10166 [Propionispira arboris]
MTLKISMISENSKYSINKLFFVCIAPIIALWYNYWVINGSVFIIQTGYKATSFTSKWGAMSNQVFAERACNYSQFGEK